MKSAFHAGFGLRDLFGVVVVIPTEVEESHPYVIPTEVEGPHYKHRLFAKHTDRHSCHIVIPTEVEESHPCVNPTFFTNDKFTLELCRRIYEIY